jgi:hypothetical protein
MLIWLVFNLAISFGGYGMYAHFGGILDFVLFLLLGWQVFGKPVQ